jgi:perosamine synthetase
MNEICEIASRKNLAVIEDAAQALGAKYNGRKVGTFGEVACFSFSTTKNLTTGEGGAVVTNNPQIAKTIRMFRDQGQPEGRRLCHSILGYNYKTTEIAASLGLSQFKKLEKILERKQRIFKFMSNELKKMDLIIPPYVPKDRTHVYTHYMVKIKEKGNFNRAVLMKALEASKIECRSYASPVHLQPFIQKLFPNQHDLPVTEEASSTTLCLPSPATIAMKNAKRILNVIKEQSVINC